MANEPKGLKSRRVLLVFRDLEQNRTALEILKVHYGEEAEFVLSDSIQTAVEILEKQTTPFSLIIFEHRGISLTFVNLLVQMGGLIDYIMCTSEANPEQIFKFPEVQMEFIQPYLSDTLLGSVRKIEITHDKKNLAKSELEYVVVNPLTLLGVSPLAVDVHVRLGDGRFVRLFRKGDALEKADVDKYEREKGVSEFFLKKSDCAQILTKQVEKIEKLSGKDPIPEEEAKTLIQDSQNVVRDLVLEMGFTAEAQLIAKASVAMTIKLIGSRPKLGPILAELKSMSGTYVSTHSFVLGKLACALAYRIGWQSATTYLKLSMAAFLHDIALRDDQLAKETSFRSAVDKNVYSTEELKDLRFHPARGAEYARQFSEIPSDVDQIIAQHHERPDGSGFPRGITGQHIAPLSALFIMAHEMIEFSMANPDVPMDTFFERREAEFTSGQFKKILLAIKNETKLT